MRMESHLKADSVAVKTLLQIQKPNFVPGTASGVCFTQLLIQVPATCASWTSFIHI